MNSEPHKFIKKAKENKAKNLLKLPRQIYKCETS